MPRIKERPKFNHNPSTHEIFICLKYMPHFPKILADHSADKLYSEFLKWLIAEDFYNNRGERITIKKIATDFKTDTARVTKWIKEIYADIFGLNYDKPELFLTSGTKVCLYFSYYDDSCTFWASLQVIPREFETVRFPFVKAKVGIDFFWVKKVEHEITDESMVTIWLQGGFVNKYREFALDKALFQKWIHFMDVHHKNDFELDDEIRKIYRD